MVSIKALLLQRIGCVCYHFLLNYIFLWIVYTFLDAHFSDGLYPLLCIQSNVLLFSMHAIATQIVTYLFVVYSVTLLFTHFSMHTAQTALLLCIQSIVIVCTFFTGYTLLRCIIIYLCCAYRVMSLFTHFSQDTRY